MDRKAARRRAEARAKRLDLPMATFECGGKTIHTNESMREALRTQSSAFEAKFGRPPGPDDPVFFDPDSSDPRPMDKPTWDEIVGAASRIGVRPEIIHAMRKTERMVAEDNWHLLTDEELDEWDAAVEEGRRMRGSS